MRRVDIVITGHRPKKLPKIAQVGGALSEAYERHGVRRVIQGMADGVDLISARSAFKMAIPFIAVRPGTWHRPGAGWERDYNNALEYAQRTDIVGQEETYPGPWAFQRRNEAMVDQLHPMHGDIVIAVWDGSPSGTANCVKYAMKKNIRVWRIDPNTFEGEYVR